MEIIKNPPINETDSIIGMETDGELTKNIIKSILLFEKEKTTKKQEQKFFKKYVLASLRKLSADELNEIIEAVGWKNSSVIQLSFQNVHMTSELIENIVNELISFNPTISMAIASHKKTNIETLTILATRLIKLFQMNAFLKNEEAAHSNCNDYQTNCNDYQKFDYFAYRTYFLVLMKIFVREDSPIELKLLLHEFFSLPENETKYKEIKESNSLVYAQRIKIDSSLSFSTLHKILTEEDFGRSYLPKKSPPPEIVKAVMEHPNYNMGSYLEEFCEV